MFVRKTRARATVRWWQMVMMKAELVRCDAKVLPYLARSCLAGYPRVALGSSTFCHVSPLVRLAFCSPSPRLQAHLLPSSWHMIDPFPLTSKSPPLALQILRPKIRGSPKSRWPTSQILATSRSGPLATRVSVWTPPLFRKDFIVYRLVQVSFVRFLNILFL